MLKSATNARPGTMSTVTVPHAMKDGPSEMEIVLLQMPLVKVDQTEDHASSEKSESTVNV